MADSRPLPCNFWSWPRIVSLLLDQKAIAVYLFTNRFTTSCGCYELPRGAVAGELGVTSHVLEEALRQFCGLGIIEMDETEVFILDWFRFHKFSSGPQLLNFWRARDKIQSAKLQRLVIDKSCQAGVPQTKTKAVFKENQGIKCQHQHQHQRQQNTDIEAAASAALVAQQQHEADAFALKNGGRQALAAGVSAAYHLKNPIPIGGHGRATA